MRHDSERTTDDAFLRVSKLSVRFPGEQGVFVALADTSFDVREGEFVAILGPSGCGKSTLLNTVAGFIKPASGTVHMRGTLITGPGVERGIAFQEHTLFPWKTVRANVAFGPRMQGVPSDRVEEIVSTLISQIGLKGFEAAYPYQLSGGMARRVSLARMLAANPEVLLMDEPFSSLDSQTRIDMQELLLSIWEKWRKTVLFVTHDIDEAILLADRVLLMGSRPGRVIQTFSVDSPRPRDPADCYRSDALELRTSILSLIREQQRASSSS